MSGIGTTFDHPATEAVAAAEAALADAAAANLWSLPAAELGRLLERAETVARRLAFLQLELTAQAERSGLARREGATSLPALLRARADTPPAVTRERLRLSAALAARDATRQAFATGVIAQRSAAAVCEALDALPAAVPAAMTGRVEELLLAVAADDGAAAVARAAAGVAHRFAPDELAWREARAADRDTLAVRLLPDGGITLRARYGVAAAAVILPALGAHATPGGTGAGAGAGAGGGTGAGGAPDRRDTASRHAEALVAICKLACGPGSPAVRGEPPHISVTVPLQTLRQELGAPPGLLGHGAPISATLARRLACDAKIIPIVLGGASEPLDVGRATRCWPAAIRRAIEARDQGCAMPGCDRPPAWCDIHHRKHWADGGATCADNGVLLCERHHTLIHHDDWHIDLKNGKPWFTPPAWIDPTQTPRLHSRYKTRNLDDP